MGLKILSLDRVGVLGEQIDLISDKFLSKNIFGDCKIPRERIQNHLKHQYSISTSSSSSSDDFVINSNLKLSTLVGFIKIEGSSIYSKLLNNNTTTTGPTTNTTSTTATTATTANNCKKVIGGSVIYKIITSTESIELMSNKDLVNGDSLQDETTHIITGIKYGEYVMVTFEMVLEDDDDKKEKEKLLRKLLKKISGSINEDNGSIDLDEEEEEDSFNQFKIKIIGNVIPNGEMTSTSFKNALDTMKNIPNYLKSKVIGDKDKPIEYEIEPISLIKTGPDRTIKSIDDEDLIEDIEIELASLLDYKTQLKNFNSLIQKKQDYLKDEQIQSIDSFMNEVNSNEKEFKENLKNLVIEVRGGKEKVSALEKLVSKYKNSNYSSKAIKKLLDSTKINVNDKVLFLDQVLAMGIKIISKSMNVFDFVKKSNRDCKFYILNYYDSTSRSNKEVWNQIYLSTFIYKFNEKRKNTKFAIIDHEIRNNDDCHSTQSSFSRESPPFIELYLNDEKKQSNVILDSNTNYLELTRSDCNSSDEKPDDSKILKLKCPSPNCSNQNISKEWKCVMCDDILFYANKILYCRCGSYPAQSCVFKCSETNHGNDYCSLPSDINQHSKYLPPRPMTLLLLGETGVGKSTFINSFVNYALYNSLEEAKDNNLQILIPIQW
ncbi:hypothetical protein ACTA71_005042 [Dictyostelium dimigraforme]